MENSGLSKNEMPSDRSEINGKTEGKNQIVL